MIVDIAQTDIVRLAVDAIVNAANASLLGGGGVDGAIHRAAGPRLLAACRDLPETRQGVRCPTGEARLTPGFDLPARYVVHTVGPVWRGGGHGEARLLAACYAHCLRLAREHAVASIAFPAISAGIYGYPMDDAARIAVDTVLTAPWRPEAVTFCTFSAAATRAYRAALDASGQRG